MHINILKTKEMIVSQPFMKFQVIFCTWRGIIKMRVSSMRTCVTHLRTFASKSRVSRWVIVTCISLVAKFTLLAYIDTENRRKGSFLTIYEHISQFFRTWMEVRKMRVSSMWIWVTHLRALANKSRRMYSHQKVQNSLVKKWLINTF